MATVRAHGKKVAARFYVSENGRTVRKSTTLDFKPTTSGLKAAERQCDEAQKRLDVGETWEVVKAWLRDEPIVDHRTLAHWAQYYLDVVASEIDGVADSTLGGYESLYNSHWRPFGYRVIHELTLEEMQNHLMSKPLDKKTKREALSLLKRICRPAGVHTFDDWKIKKSKRDKKPDPDPYTREERDELLEALKQWPIAWRYFLTGFYTGMRTGELLGLHWSDYDGVEFHVWQAMTRRKMQDHIKTEERYVIVPSNIREMLEENPTRVDGGLVFQTPEGHMFRDADWLMERWTRAHVETGVRKRKGLYPWRHTFISCALSDGMNINDIARLAGNSRAVIEKHYEKWIPKRDDRDRLRQELEKAQK